jgi:large subunit ribosomal protein L24
MKLRREDKVIVIAGRDKGKTGAVTRVLPQTGQVVVEGVNLVKRHTKPSQKQPRGGILEITKPIDVSKVMVLDPHSGKPARVGFQIKADGSKERIFKVSPNHEKAAKKSEKASKSETQSTAKAGDKEVKKSTAKAEAKKAEKK